MLEDSGPYKGPVHGPARGTQKAGGRDDGDSCRGTRRLLQDLLTLVGPWGLKLFAAATVRFLLYL